MMCLIVNETQSKNRNFAHLCKLTLAGPLYRSCSVVFHDGVPRGSSERARVCRALPLRAEKPAAANTRGGPLVPPIARLQGFGSALAW